MWRADLGRGGAMSAHATQMLVPRGYKNTEDRERLLLEHLPQVKYIARRIHGRLPAQVPLDDLIHAGVVGLIDAVEKFDPGKNVQLKSYAKFRIRGAILDSLREMDWSPRHLRRQARRIEEAHRDLKLRLGRAATEQELARELGMILNDFSACCGNCAGSIWPVCRRSSWTRRPRKKWRATAPAARIKIHSFCACMEK